MSVRISQAMINIVLFTLTICLFSPLAFAAKGGGKGKPGSGDPPPPTIAGDACKDSDGEFPAFAFSEKVLGGKKGTEFVGVDIYVANSFGDCKIKVVSIGGGTRVSFHFDNGQGTLVWVAGTQVSRRVSVAAIKIAKFDASNKIISSLLPLSSSDLRTEPQSETKIGFMDYELSSDGQRLAISEEDHLPDIHKMSILVADISTCDSNCPFDLVYSEFAGGRYDLAWSPVADQIYFSQALPDGDGWYGSLEMIEDNGVAGWSTPIPVIEQNYFLDNDARRFYGPTAVMMDHDGDGVQEEVIAMHIHFSGELSQTVDIIDVASGKIVRAGYLGHLAKFSSSPSDGSEVSLLFSNGIPQSPYMTEVNLDSGFIIQNLGAGAYVDSAD